jgi:hypothetical protein
VDTVPVFCAIAPTDIAKTIPGINSCLNILALVKERSNPDAMRESISP